MIWSTVSRGKRSRGWLKPCGRRRSRPASSMPRLSMQGSAIFIVRHNPMACSATPSSREWQQSQRIYLGRAPMAVTSKRERALQVVLVLLGLLTAGANINALVTSLLALRPTGGTTAPMFYTVLATLGVFMVLAARNPSAHRSLIAYTVWSSFAHTAVMALMAIQLPNKRGELLAGVAVTGLAAVLLFVFARSSARSEGAVPV